MKCFVLLGIMLCMSTIVFSSNSPIKANAPKSYVVETDDTLWDISTKFLKSPWLWTKIWYANPQIENPHLIYPGDMISLVYIHGEPKIMVSDRGYTGRSVKLNPKIRMVPKKSEINTLPLSAVHNYLLHPYVFSTENQINNAPYILSSKDGRLMSAAGDTIYVRGIFEGHPFSFDVIRHDKNVFDPKTGELLGVVALDVGTVNLNRVHNDVASMSILDSTMEIKPGDRLVKKSSSGLVTTFFPKAPETNIDGTVTAKIDDSKRITKFDTIIINKGKREGLSQGDVLAIYPNRNHVIDPLTKEDLKLPLKRIGLAMVYKPFEKLSYAIVLSTKEDIEIGYVLRNPR